MKTQALSIPILLLGAAGVEIDPVSVVAALTLLGGAFAVLRGRRSKS